MTPRLKGQNCQFFKTALSRNSQRRLEHKEKQTKYRNMTRNPRMSCQNFDMSKVSYSQSYNAVLWHHRLIYAIMHKCLVGGHECAFQSWSLSARWGLGRRDGWHFRLQLVRHWRNEKKTGAEMRPAIVSGIVTGHAPISYWPFFFSLSLATSQKSSKGANWRSEIFSCPHYLSRFETSLWSVFRMTSTYFTHLPGNCYFGNFSPWKSLSHFGYLTTFHIEVKVCDLQPTETRK